MFSKVFSLILSVLIPFTPSGPTNQSELPKAKYIEIEDSCLKSDMEILTTRFFGLESGSFQLKQFFSPNDIEESGMSGDIFFIWNKENHPIGVLKVIPLQDPEERKLYQKESQVLMDLSAIPFREFHPCQIRGIAEEFVCNREYGVIALDVAPGKSINQIIKNISLNSTPQKVENLLQASYLTGRALGDLHRYVQISGKKSWTYVHADPHPGNVFFHPKTQQITFIDFGLTKKVPKGSPDTALDMAKYLSILELNSRYYNIDPSIYEQAKTKCLQGYQETGPPLDQNRYQFFREDTLELFCEPITSENDSRQLEQLYAFQEVAKELLQIERSDQSIS